MLSLILFQVTKFALLVHQGKRWYRNLQDWMPISGVCSSTDKRSNVINGVKMIGVEKRLFKEESEVSPDLFRVLIRRYNRALNTTVVDFCAKGLLSAIAAYEEQEKYIGSKISNC